MLFQVTCCNIWGKADTFGQLEEVRRGSVTIIDHVTRLEFINAYLSLTGHLKISIICHDKNKVPSVFRPTTSNYLMIRNTLSHTHSPASNIISFRCLGHSSDISQLLHQFSWSHSWEFNLDLRLGKSCAK